MKQEGSRDPVYRYLGGQTGIDKTWCTISNFLSPCPDFAQVSMRKMSQHINPTVQQVNARACSAAICAEKSCGAKAASRLQALCTAWSTSGSPLQEEVVERDGSTKCRMAMFTTFNANVARSVALSDVAVLLMEKCEAWYKASQARKSCRDGEPVLLALPAPWLAALRWMAFGLGCWVRCCVSGLRFARMRL